AGPTQGGGASEGGRPISARPPRSRRGGGRVCEPFPALVPPAPVRAPFRKPLTLIHHVRTVALGEIRLIRAFFTPVPPMIVVPIRIVRPHGDGRALATLSCERARWHDTRRCQRRRHDQG